MKKILLSVAFAFCASLIYGDTIKVVLKPSKQVILSTQLSSSLEAYNLKQGEKVNKGEVIVSLDKKYFLQKKEQAEAQVLVDKAKRDFTESDYKRNVQLFQRGAIGQLQANTSKLEFDLANATLKKSIAVLKSIEFDIEACDIKSPFKGRILLKHKKDYEFVEKADPIVEIIDDETLYAVMHLKSSKMSSIKIGQTLSMRVNETGKIYSMAIVEISANIEPTSMTIEVKAELKNNNELRVGMSGILLN